MDDGRTCLATLCASPRRVRDVPAAALLAIEPGCRAVRVTVEAAGSYRQRYAITDPNDARLDALRPIDRQRVALMLAAVTR